MITTELPAPAGMWWILRPRGPCWCGRRSPHLCAFSSWVWHPRRNDLLGLEWTDLDERQTERAARRDPDCQPILPRSLRQITRTMVTGTKPSCRSQIAQEAKVSGRPR